MNYSYELRIVFTLKQLVPVFSLIINGAFACGIYGLVNFQGALTELPKEKAEDEPKTANVLRLKLSARPRTAVGAIKRKRGRGRKKVTESDLAKLLASMKKKSGKTPSPKGYTRNQFIGNTASDDLGGNATSNIVLNDQLINQLNQSYVNNAEISQKWLNELKRKIASHQDGFKTCYERALLVDAKLKGTIEAHLTINERGGVARSSFILASDTVARKQLQDCLARKVRKIKFTKKLAGENLKFRLFLQG